MILKKTHYSFHILNERVCVFGIVTLDPCICSFFFLPFVVCCRYKKKSFNSCRLNLNNDLMNGSGTFKFFVVAKFFFKFYFAFNTYHNSLHISTLNMKTKKKFRVFNFFVAHRHVLIYILCVHIFS